LPSIFEVENYASVSFQSSGRYAVLGSLHKSTKNVVIAFHGQGQLAKYFIQKLKGLQALGITVIAPEGLHYYYLNGFSGRVGTSWMTSENRLMAIANYISFLNLMRTDIISKTNPGIKIHLLGFSQGVATVSRWVEQTKFDFEQLILWGGALPPDLNKELINKRMSGKPLHQVIGKRDPFIDSEKVEDLKLLIEGYGLSADYTYYDGVHEITPDTLLKLFNPY